MGNAEPVEASDRVADLDVLRGVALFGVLLANTLAFFGPGVMATQAQIQALPTAAIDSMVDTGAKWLVGDKANSIFAFLFGLGFSLQMARAEARGADFSALYLRRLLVLLVFGLLNLVGLWAWDILHCYALAGMVLLTLRRVPSPVVLALGLGLAVVEPNLIVNLVEPLGLGGAGDLNLYSDAEALGRQAALNSGNYLTTLTVLWRYNWYDYVVSGLGLGWVIYAIGRFCLGLWVGRRGWLQKANDHLPGFRWTMYVCLPLGLAASIGVRLLEEGIAGEAWKMPGKLMRAAASAILAAGYISAIVVALRTPLGHTLLAPFRHAGRMALTNYLSQGVFIGLLVSKIAFGLGLAGKIGSTAVLGLVVVFFAFQVAFSTLWLKAFRFGPAEWLWRCLTYGRVERLRIKPQVGDHGKVV